MPFHIANAMWTEYCEQVEEENKKQNDNPGGYYSAMQNFKMPDLPKFPSLPKL